MKYRQSVIIKNVTLQKANETFNDIKFLKYLIALQPVKIINWDGTYDGAEAHMRFWFFGWKDFKVTHDENRSEKNFISIEGLGSFKTKILGMSNTNDLSRGRQCRSS